MLQFKVYGVRYDATAEVWFCKVRPGYVRTISPDADATEPVKDWMPTVGDPAVALDAEETPEIEIADGQTIYCRVATTAKGIIVAAPKIEAAATPEAGTHFQPPDADVEGDLYFPIADIEIAGDPEVVTITQIQQGGPIVVVPNLPELKNIGGEREVFKERAAAGDTYDLRTLEQLIVEDGAEIIRPLGESEEEGDTIPFRNIRKNNSESVPYTIVGSGDSVDVTLAGLTGTFTDLDEGSVVFNGGLATSTTQPPGPVDSFDIVITTYNYEIDFANETVTGPDSGSSQYLYVRKGRVSRTNPEDDVTAEFPIAISFYLAAP